MSVLSASSNVGYQKLDGTWATLGMAPNNSTLAYTTGGPYTNVGTVNPPPPPPQQPVLQQTDSFGNKILCPIVPGAKTFDSDFSVSKTLTSGTRAGLLVARGDGTCTIDGTGKYMKLAGNAPRVYMYPPDNSKMFVNMEITVDVYAGSYMANPPSWAGFEIFCRTNHHTDQTATNPSHGYYLRWARDGRIQFEREDRHTDLYVQYPMSNIPTVNFSLGKWYKMKFIVRTSKSMGWVQLEGYFDFADGKGFQNVISYADKGAWSKASDPKPLMAAATNDIAVAIRNDSVNDCRIRSWSIREVASL